MCGRFTEDMTQEQLEKHFNARLPKGTSLPLHFIGAPTQKFPVITNAKPDIITIGVGGLITIWAEKSKKKIAPQFNARAETITERPTFRNAFKNIDV